MTESKLGEKRVFKPYAIVLVLSHKGIFFGEIFRAWGLQTRFSLLDWRIINLVRLNRHNYMRNYVIYGCPVLKWVAEA